MQAKRALPLAALLVVAFLVFPGCTLKSTTPGTGGQSGDGAGEEGYQEVHYYYDFNDVLIHRDLKYDSKHSMVMETSDFKIGFQTFNGRLEHLSLVNFFIENMTKDGWKNVYVMKAQTSDLIFEKPRKRAVIKVIDQSFTNTRVELQIVELKVQAEERLRSSPPDSSSPYGGQQPTNRTLTQ